MALLTKQDASPLAGNVITPVAAAGGGDTMVGGQGMNLYVNNGGGAPITVALVTPEVVEGSLAVTDRAVSVTNATFKVIPVPSRYNDPITGLASITYSAVTSVTVAWVQTAVQP
jgi:hypothetical protein